MLLTGVREMTMIFKVKKQQITSAVVGLSLFCCRYLENDSFRGVPLMKNISDECSIIHGILCSQSTNFPKFDKVSNNIPNIRSRSAT